MRKDWFLIVLMLHISATDELARPGYMTQQIGRKVTKKEIMDASTLLKMHGMIEVDGYNNFGLTPKGQEYLRIHSA